MSVEAATRARAERAGARTGALARTVLAAGVDDPIDRLVLTARANDPAASLGELAARCGMRRHTYNGRLHRALVSFEQRGPVVAAARAALAAGVDGPADRLVLTARAEDPAASTDELAARCGMSAPAYRYRLRRALEWHAAKNQDGHAFTNNGVSASA